MLLDDEQPKPPFTAEELRVLGCLLEKQLTTPNNYPLTMNSLVLACNQKSSREPVMNLTEGKVAHTAQDLVEAGWAIIQNSGRSQRVEHKVSRQLKLDQKQQAILSVLMLRRPQTLNEIRGRTERMADFGNIGQIQSILEDWLTQEQPLVMRLPATTGRREDRYYHTLGTELPETLQAEAPPAASGTAGPRAVSAQTSCCEELTARVTELEKRLVELESRLRQETPCQTPKPSSC